MARLKANQRREQLIEVATKLFAQRGYESTTTKEIARAANVTEPILYRHFKGKQQLFVAIVRVMSERTMANWRELIEGVDAPDKQIRALAAGFPDHLRELADAYRVIHGALATAGHWQHVAGGGANQATRAANREIVEVLREHYSQVEKFFCSIMSKGQKVGKFNRKMDPHVPAWQMINMGIGYAMVSLGLEEFEDRLTGQGVEFISRAMKK
jgi:AcrR family transcriptional regulator